MTELYYTDRETARRYLNVVASLSEIGMPQFGRPMLLADYVGIEPTLTSLDQVADEIERVDEVVRRLAGHPGEYMRALVTGTRTMLSVMRNEERPYRELVRGILEIDLVPIPDTEAVRLRAQLDAGLSEMGYKGSLAQKVERWLGETSLTGEAVIEFGQEVLTKSREAMEAKVMKLPEGEGVDSFTGVRDVFYSGMSWYSGNYRGWLHFNIDKHWQRDVFVQVLCHEGYPGHKAFYALWDSLYRQGKWPMEAAFYQRNAPNNAVFEGGPEVAMHFIGWDEGDTREALALRMGQTLKDLGRISMQNACLWCNTGEMTREQAVAYMVDHFVRQDDAERAYNFFTNPLSRTNYPQYYYGRRIVDKAFALMEGSEAGRQRFWDIIYRTPHTTRTFIKAVADATGTAFDPFAY